MSETEIRVFFLSGGNNRHEWQTKMEIQNTEQGKAKKYPQNE